MAHRKEFVTMHHRRKVSDQSQPIQTAELATTPTAGRPKGDAEAIILARKTEVLTFLRSGISWRRLAYLLQIPETTCRRTIEAMPDLANEKRPEGYAAELALANTYAALAAAGYPLAEVAAWLAARARYDTARAKGAYYREQARAAQTETIRAIIRAASLQQMPPEPPRDEIYGYDTPEQKAWQKQYRATADTIKAQLVLDFDEGI